MALSMTITKDKAQNDVQASASFSTEELAFAHWEYNVNEKAYINNLITKSMYEFAKEELRKKIDCLSHPRYRLVESG